MDLKCIFNESVYSKFSPTSVLIVVVVRMKYAITNSVFVETIKFTGYFLLVIIMPYIGTY